MFAYLIEISQNLGTDDSSKECKKEKGSGINAEQEKGLWQLRKKSTVRDSSKQKSLVLMQFVSSCTPVSSVLPSGGYCLQRLFIENMTCQGQSQTVCPCFHPQFFSARLAAVVIAQHFSASRFLSTFIKVKALCIDPLALVPPPSFHPPHFNLCRSLFHSVHKYSCIIFSEIE